MMSSADEHNKLYNIIIIITLYYNILAAVVSHPIGHSLVVP